MIYKLAVASSSSSSVFFFFWMAACCTWLSLPSQLKGDWLVPQRKCFRLELFKMVERDFGLEISATQLRYKETALDQVSKLNP